MKWDPCKHQERHRKGVYRATHPYTPFWVSAPPGPILQMGLLLGIIFLYQNWMWVYMLVILSLQEICAQKKKKKKSDSRNIMFLFLKLDISLCAPWIMLGHTIFFNPDVLMEILEVYSVTSKASEGTLTFLFFIFSCSSSHLFVAYLHTDHYSKRKVSLWNDSYTLKVALLAKSKI